MKRETNEFIFERADPNHEKYYQNYIYFSHLLLPFSLSLTSILGIKGSLLEATNTALFLSSHFSVTYFRSSLFKY